MFVRDAQERDFEGIREVYAHYLEDEKDLEHFFGRVKESLGESNYAKQWDFHYLVADDDGRVVGLIGYRKPHNKLLPFTKTPKPVELYSLYAKKGTAGVGRPLAEEMMRRVRKSGYTEIVVYSSEKWKDSWGFYDKLGFVRTGTLDVGGNGQVWIMPLSADPDQDASGGR